MTRFNFTVEGYDTLENYQHWCTYTPLAVLKIKDSGTTPGHMVLPRSARILSANQRQICVQTARFSMELSDWLALSHVTLCGRGCGSASCACDCNTAKISLFCASRSSLTASYFRLIVSNLWSLHVQLPQTKAAFPAPEYCDTSLSERQKTNSLSQCCGTWHSTLQVPPGFSF